jgi:uncharacterized coiled-coil DUF342 family protein
MNKWKVASNSDPGDLFGKNVTIATQDDIDKLVIRMEEYRELSIQMARDCLEFKSEIMRLNGHIKALEDRMADIEKRIGPTIL